MRNLGVLDMSKENLKAALDALYAALAPLYAAPKPKLAVVSYFYPGALWDRMGSPALSIINPHNGPGAAASAAYTTQIDKTKARGTKVVCYVYTDYGNRLLADVKADIARAKQFYPRLDGIFVDEVDNAKPAYYESVDYAITAAFGTQAITVLNPGVKSPASTFANADIVMSFEGTPASYRARPEVLEPEGRAWHCVHSCTEADMPEMIALATKRGAGYLYITGDKYSELAPFYERLTAELK